LKNALHYINRSVTLCHNLEIIVADRRPPHKTDLGVYTCFSLFVTVARRRQKICRLTVPVASRIPNFSPVRGASQPLWQAAEKYFSLVRAEGEAEFTSRKRIVDASQLLKITLLLSATCAKKQSPISPYATKTAFCLIYTYMIWSTIYPCTQYTHMFCVFLP
jgi:hypothetical protein